MAAAIYRSPSPEVEGALPQHTIQGRMKGYNGKVYRVDWNSPVLYKNGVFSIQLHKLTGAQLLKGKVELFVEVSGVEFGSVEKEDWKYVAIHFNEYELPECYKKVREQYYASLSDVEKENYQKEQAALRASTWR